MFWKNENEGGPWGRGPRRNSPSSPDLDELIRKSQEKIKRLVPNGKNGGRFVMPLLIFIGILWATSGFYIVKEGEQGAVLRFGEWVRTSDAGIHYHLPNPFEKVLVVKVDTINQIDSGTPPLLGTNRGDESDNLMLTGDENIVSVNFTVHWFINDIRKYLFKVVEPDLTVKRAAESAVREIVAQTPMAYAITKGRGEISEKAQKLLQKMLDEYQAGIQVQRVQLKSVDPPSQVLESFRDVQRARADRESLINKAKAYQNSLIPPARGEAMEIVKKAEGYQQAKLLEAEGKVSRFSAVYKEYRTAPEVTQIRLQIENTENVLTGLQKILITDDSKGVQGILPYVPLTDLKPKTVQTQEETK